MVPNWKWTSTKMRKTQIIPENLVLKSWYREIKARTEVLEPVPWSSRNQYRPNTNYSKWRWVAGICLSLWSSILCHNISVTGRICIVLVQINSIESSDRSLFSLICTKSVRLMSWAFTSCWHVWFKELIKQTSSISQQKHHTWTPWQRDSITTTTADPCNNVYQILANPRT